MSCVCNSSSIRGDSQEERSSDGNRVDSYTTAFSFILLFSTSTTNKIVHGVPWMDRSRFDQAYVSRVRRCLLVDESKLALHEFLPQEAVKMLFEKLAGRLRPVIVGMVCHFASVETNTKRKDASE